MNILEKFEKLINEHGSAAIMRERLELFRDQIELLQSQNENLRKQNNLLSGEVERLKKQATTVSEAEDFVRKNGILWRTEGDSFEPHPYCPNCEEVMHTFPPIGRAMKWICSNCNRSFEWQRAPAVEQSSQ